jgi:hypothetical protein
MRINDRWCARSNLNYFFTLSNFSFTSRYDCFCMTGPTSGRGVSRQQAACDRKQENPQKEINESIIVIKLININNICLHKKRVCFEVSHFTFRRLSTRKFYITGKRRRKFSWIPPTREKEMFFGEIAQRYSSSSSPLLCWGWAEKCAVKNNF